MTELRCAAYCRYSTDRQNPLSIEDQLRKCREFADQQGWKCLDNHIYTDAAVSGTTDDRIGLRRLLEAASQSQKPFDVVLVDDTSRLSRKLRDSLRIFDQLTFANVRLVFVSQGIDSDSEQAEVLLATHGIVDSLYIRELAKKVFRGVEGRILKGLHAGGRCFGYDNQPIEDPMRKDTYGRPVINGVRLVVNEAQAETVRRIYTLYADGYSLKRITKLFNAEGVRSPQPQQGRISQSWCPTSIREILHNDRYRGVVIWGKTKKLRSPNTGKRIYRRRPESEWVIVQAPEQRIVSDELWAAVKQRLKQVRVLYGNDGRKAGLLRAQAMNSPYLFSGLLKCGLCGANMNIVSGRGQRRHASYGCPLNAQRGVCSNSLSIRRDVLEGTLLEKLQATVLTPEVVEYTLDRFEKELVKAFDSLGENLGQMRRRKAKLEEEIRNLARAIAEGHYSPSFMGEIADREREISEITDRLLEANPDSVKSRLKDIRSFAISRISDLRGLLNSDALRARAELSKHIQAIKLFPNGRMYVASGSWDLLGVGRMDGAAGRS